MPTGSVGTLNIKISVSGVQAAQKEIQGLNGTDFSGLLGKLNKVRWAFLAVQTVGKLISGPIKAFASIASTSFKAVYKIIDTAVIKPLMMIKDFAVFAGESLVGLGAVGGAAMIGFGAVSVSQFASFEEGMKNSLALFADVQKATGITRKNMEKNLIDVAEKVAVAWGIAPEIVSSGLYDMASAGLTAAESQETLYEMGRFARASQMEFGEAVQFALSSMRAFNQVNADGTLQTERMGYFMDVLAKSVLNSQMRFPELQQALTNVGPIAAAFNVDIEDISAALMVMANAGLRGGAAGTALKTMMGRLQKGTGETKVALGLLGLSLDDVNLSMFSLEDVLGTISKAFDNMADPTQKNAAMIQLLGLRAAKGAAAISALGTDAMSKFKGELLSSAGALDQIANEQMQAFINQSKRMGSAIKVMQAGVGEALAGGLSKGIDKFMESWERIDAVLTPIYQTWGDWLGKILPSAIEWLTTTLENMSGVLISGSKFLQGVFIDIGSAITTVLGDAFAWLNRNWEQVLSTAISVWQGITDVISDAWTGITNFLFGTDVDGEGLFGSILDWWSANGETIVTQVKGIFEKAGEIIGMVVGAWSNVFTSFNQTSGGVLQGINGVLESMIGWLKAVGSDGTTGLEKLSETFKSMGTFLGTTFQKGITILKQLFNTKSEAGGLNGVLINITDMFGKLTDFIGDIDPGQVITAFNGMANAITAIAESSLPDFLNGVLDILSSPGFTDTVMVLYSGIKLAAGISMWLLTAFGNFSVFLAPVIGVMAGIVGWALKLVTTGSGFLAVLGWVGAAVLFIQGVWQSVHAFLQGDFGGVLAGILKVVAAIAIVVALIAGGWIPLLVAGIAVALAWIIDSFDGIKLAITKAAVWMLNKFAEVGQKIHDFLVEKFGKVGEFVAGLLGASQWKIDVATNLAEKGEKHIAEKDEEKKAREEADRLKALPTIPLTDEQNAYKQGDPTLPYGTGYSSSEMPHVSQVSGGVPQLSTEELQGYSDMSTMKELSGESLALDKDLLNVEEGMLDTMGETKLSSQAYYEESLTILREMNANLQAAKLSANAVGEAESTADKIAGSASGGG